MPLSPPWPCPRPHLSQKMNSPVEKRSCFLCLFWAFSFKFSLRQKFGKASLRKAA